MSGSLTFAPVLRAAARASRLTTVVGRALRRLEQSVEVLVSRRYLGEMDDRMLKDLGISRAQAEFEARRPAWQLGAREDRRVEGRRFDD